MLRRLACLLVALELLVVAPARAQFTIPNNNSTAIASTNQSLWMQADIDALVAGVGGSGVLSGCAVTAQAIPALSVAVASGSVRVASSTVSVSSGTVTLAASSALPRIDLVVANNAGVKSAITGTPASLPVAPALPATSALLAAVYVSANTTAIQSTAIVDKRVFPSTGLAGSCTFDGSNNMVCPASITSGGASAGALDLTQGAVPGSFPANAVSIIAPVSVGTSYHLTLPASVPAGNGYALTATTGGVGSWTAIAATPGGSSNDVQCNYASVFAACDTGNLTYNAGSNTLQASKFFATQVAASLGVLDSNVFPVLSFTAPTVASGFGASSSFATGSKAVAFDLNVGTTPGSTGAITLPAAAHGWSCLVIDMNTAVVTRQTAYTTTTASFTGASSWTNNDHLVGQCVAF